jgi:photosystem II stability/assembly factor-like uncharacterized protein
MNQETYSAAGPMHRAGRYLQRGLWRFPAVMALLAIFWVSGALFNVKAQAGFSVPAQLAPRSLLIDAVSINNGIWAVGERGHMLFSSDHGRTWRQVQVPTRTTLTAVTFHDDRAGWAVGHEAVILRTTDGGESWEKVHNEPDGDRPLLDIWFQDALNGFAIGAYGLCLRTRDGGASWEPVRISDDEWHLHHMARSKNGRLYIAAEAGHIYRSDDGGDTWVTLTSPYNGSFFGVLPLDEDSLIVYGLRGHVYRSDDGGDTWRSLPTDTIATLSDGIVLADGRILLAGLAGTLLIGREENTSFESIQGPGRMGIWAVVQTLDKGLVCFGERGSVCLDLD